MQNPLSARRELLSQLGATLGDLSQWADDLGDREAADCFRRLLEKGVPRLERRFLCPKALAPAVTSAAPVVTAPQEIPVSLIDSIDFLEQNMSALGGTEKRAVGDGLIADIMLFQRRRGRSAESVRQFARLSRLGARFDARSTDDALQMLSSVGEMARITAEERLARPTTTRPTKKAPRERNAMREISPSVRAFTNGKRVLIVGGIPDSARIAAIESALGVEVVWKAPERSFGAKFRTEAEACDLGVVLIRLSSHEASRQMLDWKREGVLENLVVMPCGFSVAQLVHEIEAQVLR